MSYTPLNAKVYLAANEAVAGFYSGAFATANASWCASLAAAWAEAVDMAWGPNAFTSLDLQNLAACSVARFMGQGFGPNANAPPQASAYAADAAEIVALVRSTTALVAAQGIDPNSTPSTTAGTRLALTEGVPCPLFAVDMTFAPDNSFGCRMQFAIEVTDGTDVQLREGDVNAALVLKNGVYNTAQAVNGTNAVTAGSLTATFLWDTTGPKPVLTVTIVSSLTPTESHINFFIPFSSHPAAVTKP